MKEKTKIAFLIGLLSHGIKEKDKDATRSSLEDLTMFLSENGYLGEF